MNRFNRVLLGLVVLPLAHGANAATYEGSIDATLSLSATLTVDQLSALDAVFNGVALSDSTSDTLQNLEGLGLSIGNTGGVLLGGVSEAGVIGTSVAQTTVLTYDFGTAITGSAVATGDQPVFDQSFNQSSGTLVLSNLGTDTITIQGSFSFATTAEVFAGAGDEYADLFLDVFLDANGADLLAGVNPDFVSVVLDAVSPNETSFADITATADFALFLTPGDIMTVSVDLFADGSAAAFPGAPVPLPAALPLLAGGLMAGGFAGYRRRQG